MATPMPAADSEAKPDGIIANTDIALRKRPCRRPAAVCTYGAEGSEESSTVSAEDDVEAEDASAEPESETRDEEPDVDDLEDLLGGEIGFDPDPEDPQE